MVCDGESVTLPDACELFTTVRDALPAFAVMVMEDALLDCHVSVTLCPTPIDVLLAEKVRLGGPPVFDMACDPQPVSVAKMIITKRQKPVRRSVRDFIRTLVPWARFNHSDSELRAGVAPPLLNVWRTSAVFRGILRLQFSASRRLRGRFGFFLSALSVLISGEIFRV